MPQRTAKLQAMAKLLTDLAQEAMEMGENNLASLIVAASIEAQHRSLGIRKLQPALTGQKQNGPPS